MSLNRNDETSHLYQLLRRVNQLHDKDASPEEAEAFHQLTAAVWEKALERPQLRRPRVFVGVPYSHHVHNATHLASTQWASDQHLDVGTEFHCSSLLVNGFNRLLMDCFNHANQFDLFCLLHADIVPRIFRQPPGRGFWLDVMVRDLYEHGFDVLHVPAAIKDVRGVTSTAIGRKDWGQQWNHVKKLSVREIGLLPKVFTLRDCERLLDLTKFGPSEELCLLPNTGCMLMRLDKLREHRFPGFRCVDELHWQTDGKCVAGNVPEDWGFGRWCAHAGFKVGGTTNLATTHVGLHEFVSDQDWGCVLSEYGGEVTAKVF